MARTKHRDISDARLFDNTITANKLVVTGVGNYGQMLTSDADGSFQWEDISDKLVQGTDISLTTINADSDQQVNISAPNSVAYAIALGG